MLNKIPHAPLASAILLMLAACGGGGGNDAAPVAGIHAGTTNNVAASSTQTNSTQGGSTSTDAANASSTSTNTASQGTAAPAAGHDDTRTALPPAAADTPVAAISHQGIRGDVMLTALAQLTCNDYLSLATAIDGPRVTGTDATAMPTVGAGHALREPSNYVRAADAPNIISPLAGICATHVYQAPANGSYDLDVYSNPVYRDSRGATRGFHYLDADFRLTVTDTGFSLAGTAELENAEDKGRGYLGDEAPGEQSITVRSNGDFTMLKSGLASFDTFKEWTDGLHGIQMSVLPLPQQPSRFKLCWKTKMQFANRLQCTAWEVPANWEYGQPLTYVDQYLSDDRSTYPNENRGTQAHFHNQF